MVMPILLQLSTNRNFLHAFLQTGSRNWPSTSLHVSSSASQERKDSAPSPEWCQVGRNKRPFISPSGTRHHSKFCAKAVLAGLSGEMPFNFLPRGNDLHASPHHDSISDLSSGELSLHSERERDRKRHCKRKESMSFFPPILESVGPIEE